MSEAGTGGRGESNLIDSKDNSWDNATLYANRTGAPKVRLLVVVGDKDSNYQPNLDWCAHLAKLNITHELVIVPGAGHGIDWKIQNTDRRIFDFIAESLNHFPHH